MVAVAHAEFGADPQLVAGAGAGQPAGEKILGKHEVVAEFRGERAATVGDGHLAMLAVERAQVKHLRMLDELRPDEEAGGVVGRQHVLGNGEMGVIPSDGQELAGGATIEAGDLVEFLRSLGRGVAVGLDVDGDAELAGLADELHRDAGGGGGRGVVVEELDVDETHAEIALGDEAGDGIGDALGVEAAHEAEAEAVGDELHLRGDESAHAVEAGGLNGAELVGDGPRALGGGPADQRPRSRAHDEGGGGGFGFHE